MESYTGYIFTLGKVSTRSSSTKKENTRSATESKLVRVDDKKVKVIWSKKLIECQGFKIKLVTMCKDKTSTIELLKMEKVVRLKGLGTLIF